MEPVFVVVNPTYVTPMAAEVVIVTQVEKCRRQAEERFRIIENSPIGGCRIRLGRRTVPPSSVTPR